MDYNHEELEQTLSKSPMPRKVLTEKTVETLKIPSNLTPVEMQDFLGSAFFNENAALLLYMNLFTQPLVFSPAAQTTLGRIDQIDSQTVCLNLSPYDAREQGVSRIHAMLHRSDIILEIQDLDSKNGTYLNGYRLAPNETRILRDRDELVLGTLRIRIAFQYGSNE